MMLLAYSARGADYRIEPIKEAPPEELAADIVAQLSPTGFKIVQGEKRTLCEIWPAKHWGVRADFKPSDTILYPLVSGSLVGAVRLPRKGADFRGHDIERGLYTLRYADQPVDGNHVGTFPTRDFLLLLPASADTSPAVMAEMDLFKLSAQSAESTHPAIWPLIKAAGADPAPALRHVEPEDWWTVRFGGTSAEGRNVVLELVVVGKAAE